MVRGRRESARRLQKYAWVTWVALKGFTQGIISRAVTCEITYSLTKPIF